MNVNRENCTQIAEGKVKDLRIKGQDFPTMISVEYQVGDNNYIVTESLKLKNEKVKIGFLTIGQKRVPAMGNTAIGSSAKVSYNLNNPEESFITDNIGKANV